MGHVTTKIEELTKFVNDKSEAARANPVITVEEYQRIRAEFNLRVLIASIGTNLVEKTDKKTNETVWAPKGIKRLPDRQQSILLCDLADLFNTGVEQVYFPAGPGDDDDFVDPTNVTGNVPYRAKVTNSTFWQDINSCRARSLTGSDVSRIIAMAWAKRGRNACIGVAIGAGVVLTAGGIGLGLYIRNKKKDAEAELAEMYDELPEVELEDEDDDLPEIVIIDPDMPE